ncbi:hypothetical protein CYK55_00185 (plasmid) [Enterococcus mundtii]|nr:hypothetical protein CYK55_00185 [Enterococcus mundtii]QCJ57921.1 hypothetical protein DDJ96_15150 [Enterococcus mundtii]
MNNKAKALLLGVLSFISTILKDLLALPMPNMLIATLCIVIILIVVTFCVICLLVVNKKNSFD